MNTGVVIFVVVVSAMILLAGTAYIVYLTFVFPRLVPGYGGGEPFSLSSFNNFVFQIPWEAYTRLHLTLQANDTVNLYVNGNYVCDCVYYELVIEQKQVALVMLKSNLPVEGRFTAWQEVPPERFVFASTLILVGLAGLLASVILFKRTKSNQ